MANRTYEDAVNCLNTLQSNAAEIKAVTALPIEQRPSKKLDLVRVYLSRIGYSPDDLNSLNVIHITGTKGKGSTCALVDSILRSVNPNWRIGLYTSPHLVAVRERIRLNGAPLSEELFARYFFEVWDKLGASNEAPTPELPLRPMYFRFLTLMAFHVFISLKVDATILEVGIGGLLDDTNIVPRPIVTGVSSIGYDHMNVLGSTLGDIAFQKGGIFKPGVPAITAQQLPEALASLRLQADRRQASELVVIPPSEVADLQKVDVGIPGAHQKENAALAIRLAGQFVAFKQPNECHQYCSSSHPVLRGLSLAKWPGRCQRVTDPDDPMLTWFLDGAHTVESLQCCLEWFISPEGILSSSPKSQRILVLNCTKGRSAAAFLKVIADASVRQLDKYDRGKDFGIPIFSQVLFCTNITYADGGFKKDLLSLNSEEPNLSVQSELASSWATIYPSFPKERIYQLPSIEHAVEIIKSHSNLTERHVLVTGSLHLVGGLMEVASLGKVAL